MSVAELRQIWDRIPAIACQRKCQECCGPIAMLPAEYRLAFGTKAPVKMGGFPLAVDPLTGNCPKLLRSGDCGVYDVRPTICRLWGVVHAMACPFGCVPERWLTDQEAHVILDAVRRVRL